MRNTTSHLLLSSKYLICILLISSSLALAAERTVRTVNIGHAQLNVEVWESDAKNSETIIALPGSGGDVSRYKYLAPLIADSGYRVIAINQRGIGGSTGELEDLTLHDYAADVAAIIDVLDLQKAHLLGWALGNRTSRVVATDFPNKVASISLIAAGGLVRPLTEPGELGRLLGEAGIPDTEKFNLARRTLFSPHTSDRLVYDYVQELKYWPDARRSQGQANRNTPLEQWWAGGNGPMLIVQGVDDKTAPPENGRQMKQEFGERITLVNLEGAGHAMGLEKPRETAAAIVSFLAKHAIAASR
jgi:pimeloyl-ACP methyl ester carboxylesterase